MKRQRFRLVLFTVAVLLGLNQRLSGKHWKTLEKSLQGSQRITATPATATKFDDNTHTQSERQRRRQEEEEEEEEESEEEESSPKVSLTPYDYIYKPGPWDGAPIVLEEHKLIFFTVAKVGCTVWKQLFRRMAGYEDDKWKRWKYQIHDPRKNGLTYLYHYTVRDANRMLTDPEWTRAIFVRDPRERVLSAYLDKGQRKGGSYLSRHCCGKNAKCMSRASGSFRGFLETIVTQCPNDPHWISYTERLDGFLSTINFVGNMESAHDDAKRLLNRIGAWTDYGANGWGPDGQDEIFTTTSSIKHATNASAQVQHYFHTTNDDKKEGMVLEELVERLYHDDYDTPQFGLVRTTTTADSNTDAATSSAATSSSNAVKLESTTTTRKQPQERILDDLHDDEEGEDGGGDDDDDKTWSMQRRRRTPTKKEVARRIRKKFKIQRQRQERQQEKRRYRADDTDDDLPQRKEKKKGLSSYARSLDKSRLDWNVLSPRFNLHRFNPKAAQTNNRKWMNEARMTKTKFRPVNPKDIRLDEDAPRLLRIERSDYPMRKGSWDGAPIVLEKHRLLFFSVPKVGCTVFKQLFRRMMGHHNWNKQNDKIPHNPTVNGLKYLWHYPSGRVKEMMTSPDWTRAIFVRDPKERLLSAYLDKALKHRGTYVMKHCCPRSRSCKDFASASFENFVDLVSQCRDPHWNPQTWRMEAKYWPHVNFVGHLESVTEDAKRLLTQVEAWDEYGASGWGARGTEAIFESVRAVRHKTGSHTKLTQYYTTATLESMVEKLYQDDYLNPVFNLTQYKLV